MRPAQSFRLRQPLAGGNNPLQGRAQMFHRKTRSPSTTSAAARRSFQPTLETLEDRLTPAPVVNQIVPVGVYINTNGAFGLAYDSSRNLIWFTEGDSGDSLIHSLKPFK